MGRSRTRNDANQKPPLSRHFAPFPRSANTPDSGSCPEGSGFKSPRYYREDSGSAGGFCEVGSAAVSPTLRASDFYRIF